MLPIQDVKGAIFDVDDTLLDNYMADHPAKGLHELSRLVAIREVGRLHKIPELEHIAAEEMLPAFQEAQTHSLQGAVWRSLYVHGLVDSEELDPTNQLLQEIVELKDKGHEAVLREQGKEVKDASKFVRALAENGLANKMAIASSAARRDIDVFLELFQLKQYFPDERIISIENVTKPKPDPECFDLAFKTLGLPNSDRPGVLAFDDHPRGIQSAKAANLFACGIASPFISTLDVLKDAGADAVAHNYAEFAQLLGLQLI